MSNQRLEHTLPNQSKTIMVVIPVYNEAECLGVLVDRLNDVFQKTPHRFVILFVDDGSRDETFSTIRSLAAQNTSIQGIRLARNVGHQSALSCGLQFAGSDPQIDAVITMDGDLQHPPEILPALLGEWERGFQIVNTIRTDSPSTSIIKRCYSQSFYRLFNSISGIEITPNGSDFRLIDKIALRALNSMNEYFKFYRGLIQYVGFRQTTIAFKSGERYAGKPSFTFRKSLQLASNGIFSFSTFALKIPFFLGLFVLAILFFYFMLALYLHIYRGLPFVPGWTSLMVTVVACFGVQLVFMGVLGLYFGKMFIELKGRPSYFVAEKI